ncbi:MAG: GIY-YIG nuclease family protein [Bacteroidales bacterium]|nr:GIY-YIG nuclease family protein [Bacteroidales bacterium]
MNGEELLKGRVEEHPRIYAYIHPTLKEHKGWIKVGYTTCDVQERIKEQHRTAGVAYKIVGQWAAMRQDGTTFTDKDVHRLLRKAGYRNPEGEWFRCTLDDVEHAVRSAQMGADIILQRTATFAMRYEQAEAVSKTADYLNAFAADKGNRGLTPHFLWNAKMRFGKTFTTYQLARRMGWRRLLVLTFKPAVRNAWRDDLLTHVDFEGWQFCEKQEAGGQPREFNKVDEERPFVCFASFQDVLGRNEMGGIKATNEWLPTVRWDCIVIDEYHYGAWGKRAKDFYDKKDALLLERAAEVTELMGEDANDDGEMKSRELFDEGLMPLTTRAYLYLSGTPFRAIANGEFIEEQIFNWTYADEQKAKSAWRGEGNPYNALPQMVMMTYQMPKSISEVADQGEFDEFDLNEFFRAEDDCFVHEEYVQRWLDLIRGGYSEQIVTTLKQGAERPPMPFSDVRLQRFLQHTYWFLPSVAACRAMAQLLGQRHNSFYSKYRVIVAAGSEAGIGASALEPVLNAMDNPQETQTITLSCGKLSTGVTVRPWSGILMLRNTTSPETYFQTAFRVQSPWTTRDDAGDEVVLKPCCYLFDFAPNRALRLVQEYSCQLNVQEGNPERKVEEFIQFLPILAYDGATMRRINAAEVMDMALSGTTATLLARRWESAVLVNVDNSTLQRLMGNEAAMTALMSIEGFRTLNKDIETIINKSEKVKQAKTRADDDKKAKHEISEEEKEMKSLRKQIQEKLLKFATHIPAFMYLSDYREYCLKDVIRQLEPELFLKVTGLTVKDFDLLVSLGVFNGELMNDAVYKFKRYEDSSLTYTGLDHSDRSRIGLYDTVVEGLSQ